MPDLEQLSTLIEPEARELGFDLVRVAWIKGDEPTLQIMAERPDTRQLNIDDCAALSHRISDKFDELDPIDEAYRLEVSSPGIDRPLTRLKDFSDWVGHEARIELAELSEGRKRFRGNLIGVDGDMVLIDDGGPHQIAFNQIHSAKLVLTDRLIASTAPIDIGGADEIDDETTEQEQED